MNEVTLPYYTWTNEEESISHTGILTKESDTNITLLTKYGEMTVPRDDGEFTEATREDFEKSTSVNPAKPSTLSPKNQQVKALIAAVPGATKEAIIAHIATSLQINPKTAQIYYYKYR